MSTITVLWDGPVQGVVETSAFTKADFAYLQAPDIPDWSETGDFIEIDVSLLIAVSDGIQRLIPLTPIYLDSRQILSIPFTNDLPKKFVLLGDPNKAVNVKICVYQADALQLHPGWKYELLDVTTGLEWQLQEIPISPERSKLYLNGVKQLYGVDYIIDSAILVWAGTLAIEASDTIEIYYL